MAQSSDTRSADDSSMPVWTSESEISAAWVQSKTGIQDIKTCTVEDISNETRKAESIKDRATLRLTLVLDCGDDISLVIKQTTEKTSNLAKQLGLAREALFYDSFADNLPKESTPKVYYSYGKFERGEKCIIMEDLSDGVDSGALFGNGNPNNWNRDLDAFTTKAGNPSARDVALQTFVEIAKVHATYWKNNDLLLTPDKYWLRGQKWIQGQSKETWEASQNIIRSLWSKTVETEKSVTPMIEWDPLVRAAVEKAVEGISWNAQIERLNVAGHFTLVHGDFWPGNCMYMPPNDTNDERAIRFLDWEMVGIGSGPQELGQYVISNMDPKERKACEKDLVKAYYDTLSAHTCTSSNVPWEYVWREYKIGGVERWIWFLIYFVGNGMGDWVEYFQTQISSFMKDHNMTAADITQPRP